MVILFTPTNIGEHHQNHLKNKYPDHTFVFCQENSKISDYVQDAEVIVTYGSDLTEELIGKAKKLKWIMVISAGIDELPFTEIKKRKILVTNVSGIHKVPMAEYAISMLLHVYRQEKVLNNNQAKASWDRSVRMKEVTGRTMLVLGTGAIGQEVARLAKAFHMHTIGVSRSGRAVEYFDETYKINLLEDVLYEADFIVSVLPSTEETKGLITFRHFEIMKREAVFLNMGRGDIVRSEHILRAVREGEIAHAILDVFEEEPLPEDHPFWKSDQITVTPHLSGISPQYHDRALHIFEQNLDVYLKGDRKYINKINLERGY